MDEIFRPKEYKHKLGGYKHKLLYILSTRDPPHNRGHIQTESEGLENDISCKWIFSRQETQKRKDL